MKFKVNICNYSGFEEAVRSCQSDVFWHEDNKKIIITPVILKKLEAMYKQNRGIINLWIETKDQKDYFKLIFAACM